MKSLQQLRTELTGLRLKATNVSMWSVAVSVNEHAERAINDAINIFEMPVVSVYSSLSLPMTPAIIALPNDIKRIVRIETQQATWGSRRELTAWRHTPTAMTNLLQVGMGPAYPYSAVLPPDQMFITYESKLSELPKDLAVIATMTTSGGAVSVTGGTPVHRWRAPGYFELSHPLASTDTREVVRYEQVLPTGFTGLTRAVEGGAIAWPIGTLLSAVLPVDDRYVAVLQAKAQATMYEYWLRDRAAYDQYTAIASQQTLSLQELLTLSRAFEDKADRSYERVKTIPQVTRMGTRVRRADK